MTVKEKIIDILAQYSKLEDTKEYLNQNDDLTNLEINSITFIKVVVALENKFQFEFDDDDLEANKFTTLSQLVDYVESRTEITDVIDDSNHEELIYDDVKKEIIQIIKLQSDNPILDSPDFTNLMELNLSINQLEKIIYDLGERFNIVIFGDTIQTESLFLLDNLCEYILNRLEG